MQVLKCIIIEKTAQLIFDLGDGSEAEEHRAIEFYCNWRRNIEKWTEAVKMLVFYIFPRCIICFSCLYMICLSDLNNKKLSQYIKL